MRIEKLYPECKDYIWGGERLKKEYNKNTDKSPCAESWELSFHKDGKTRIASGKTLEEVATGDALGTNVKDFPYFPVLNKFIDAKGDLSVQVHPSDDYALKNENSFGKTEMWYIVDADEGAGIYLGFKDDVTKEEYEAAIVEKRLTELLNFYPVKAGDCYFIPSGTIHAIGAGCLIYEIQQNSNLTYRVYDYGRKDKNGNERELHVDKALKVTTLKKHENKNNLNGLLGASKYFSVNKLSVSGEVELSTDERSFAAITCVFGSGFINGERIALGDSYFVPAGTEKYIIEGEMEIIMTQVRKYYIGIDLGGTYIKGGIVDDSGKIIVSDKVPTEVDGGSGVVSANIAKLCNILLDKANMTASDVVGIGMGVPGMIDSERGEVVYANNLHWEHFMIGETVESLTGLPVKIANDANVAALGEAKFGAGREYKDTVMLTLGTGVGGGVVLNGALFEGNKSAGTELGHHIIVVDGEPCSCGNAGCLEAYASATALIRDTKRAMQKNPDSKMWQVGSLEAVDGRCAFDYKDVDDAARAVVDNYIKMLGVGILNIANIFRPQAVILGGGVCAQGDNLILPLKKFLSDHIYGGNMGPVVEIVIASLKNEAGLLGAAALWL